MKVRKAAVTDLDVLRELWEALYAECPEPEHQRKEWDQVADDVRRGIGEHVALLAEDRDVPVGFVLARPRNERTGYVSDLYVRPEYRKHGIARELLRRAAAALEPSVVTLDVDVANAGARRFYDRLGFREQSLRLVIDTERLREPKA